MPKHKTKVCTTTGYGCGKRKPVELFSKSMYNLKDGLRSTCKACDREYGIRYRSTDNGKDHIAEAIAQFKKGVKSEVQIERERVMKLSPAEKLEHVRLRNRERQTKWYANQKKFKESKV